MSHIENDDFEEIVKTLKNSNYFFVIFEEGGNVSTATHNINMILACDMIRAMIITAEEQLAEKGNYAPELGIAKHAIETYLQRISDSKGYLLAKGITDMLNKTRWN